MDIFTYLRKNSDENDPLLLHCATFIIYVYIYLTVCFII